MYCAYRTTNEIWNNSLLLLFFSTEQSSKKIHIILWRFPFSANKVENNIGSHLIRYSQNDSLECHYVSSIFSLLTFHISPAALVDRLKRPKIKNQICISLFNSTPISHNMLLLLLLFYLYSFLVVFLNILQHCVQSRFLRLQSQELLQ